MPLHLGVAELSFGLAFELRLEDLDADHGGKAFADVLASEVRIGLLEDARLARIPIEHVRQRRAEAGQVAAALDGVDRVGESKDVLDERLVVLQRDLNLSPFDLAVDVE